MANTIDLVLRATNQASPAITGVARELGALDLAGRNAAGGGLADMGKAIPTIAGTLLNLASAIPGPIGLIAQLGSLTVATFTQMSAKADETLKKMTALAEGIAATFEEAQAEVARIRAEAAGNVGAVVEQQYAKELAAIEKTRLKQIQGAKDNALQIQAIEAESAGKRMVVQAQYEAQLAELHQKRLELAKQLGTQLAEAEVATTQALLVEQGKKLQAIEVGAARQAEILAASSQKQLEEIAKLGGSEQEQYELRRQAQEVFAAQSLQLTTETEIKRRAVLTEQAAFLKTLAQSAAEAEASLVVAVLESQGKQVAAVTAAAAQRKTALDAELAAALERIAKLGLSEQQAIAARLTAEREYNAKSQQLAVETADKKKKLAAEVAAKEAEEAEKAAAAQKAAAEKAANARAENFRKIQQAQEMVRQSAAAAADAEARATALFLESQGKRVEALQVTSTRQQQVIQETYDAEIRKSNEAAMLVQQRREFQLNAERKQAADSITLSLQTAEAVKQIGASWNGAAASTAAATEQVVVYTAWSEKAVAAANKLAQSKQVTVSTPIPSHIKTAQEALNWMKSGQASITPASAFGPKTEKPTTTKSSGSSSTNNVNVNVGSVNDKTQIQILTNAIMQAIADAERRRT